MEDACRSIEFGDSEYEIAGALDYHLHQPACTPLVTLVASDERIERFRHPIPTAKTVERYVMLVTCAAYGGLISCLTRFVSFGPCRRTWRPSSRRSPTSTRRSTCRPGRGGCWGPVPACCRRPTPTTATPTSGSCTTRAGRRATPTARRRDAGQHDRRRRNQAFAWNPSITGIKSEDTVLCTEEGWRS
jgi:hypothetical protein